MPTQRISYREFRSGIWLKGPKENNPASTLRRGLSIFPTRGGSLLSRSGSVVFFDLDAHSLYKFKDSSGVGHRIIGAGTALYQGTSPSTEVLITTPSINQSLNGNRLSFMDLSANFLSTDPTRITTEISSLFVAGGGATFKLNNAFAQSNWGIQAPTAAQWTLGNVGAGAVALAFSKSAQLTSSIETFDAKAGGFYRVTSASEDETSDITGNSAPPDATTDTVRKTTGPGSLRLRLLPNQHVTAARNVSFNAESLPSATTSTDEDYISFDINVNRPGHIASISLKVFVGTFNLPATDQTASDVNPDYYQKDFSIKLVRRKRTKTLRGSGDFIPLNPKKQRKYLKRHPATEQTELSTQEFLDEDFSTIAVTRKNWTRVTIPKSQFSAENGAGQTGKTWANVVGYEFDVLTKKAGGATVHLDNMHLAGGIGMRGDYLYTITWLNDTTGSRSNPPLNADGTIVTIAVPGNNRQSVAFTGLPTVAADRTAALMPTSPDPQITHLELWRNIGNGGLQFYRVSKIAIDSGTSFTDAVGDYIGMKSNTTGSGLYLDTTVELFPDNAPFGIAFRSNIATPTDLTDYCRQAVYYRAAGRTFGLSNNFPARIIYSPIGRPESFVNFLEPGTPDEGVLRLVEWHDVLYAFTARRIYEIRGAEEPFVAQEVLGAPGAMPCPEAANAKNAFTVVATPGGILYQAQDGVRVFDGQYSSLVADDALAPVMRGSTSDGITAFNGIVASYGRDEYLISDLNTTLSLRHQEAAWRNIGPGANALYHEPDTRVCLATIPVSTVGTGVLVTGATTTTPATMSTATPYWGPASVTASSATLSDHQSIIPADVTFTAIAIQLSTALVGGGTATYQLNVNGVSQAGLTAVLASGASSGSGTGTVAVVAGDLVAIEAVFTGGTTTSSVRFITLGYTTDL